MPDDRDWERRERGSSFMAGLIGALIGAAGAAVAIFFSNRENRQKTKEKFEELREKGNRAMEEIRHRAEESRDKIEEKVEERSNRPQQTNKNRK